ncbi:MAG: translation initiation factor IF-2 [candidate division WOR-3 bacterium]|nr:translation initiation factor IF-2 [candidate division WOR-3 bacterium]MCX7837132.1 translation initiation factor IF-2 [candidate division WOR-3 bacterium]MDW8113659.1 translation initiation factor IF-2 [candidate division WOR-3 bacterium]
MKTERLKVNEVAKKLNLSPKAVVNLLKELGFKERGYTSFVTTEEYEAIKKKIKEEEKLYSTKIEKKEDLKEKRKEPPINQEREIKKTIKTKKVEKKEIKSPEKNKIEVFPFMTVSELANAFDVLPADIIKACLKLGLVATINQRLDLDTIYLLADEFKKEIIIKEELPTEKKLIEAPLLPRPPVVTVIGHVDHGKTTLLDYIRKTKIAEKEVGRITQHVGVSVVNYKNEKIIFLDTPGHEAFTAMRVRGIQVTDIAILVVAANEGVKPQTEEAINHVRAAGVPIIVAITKIDLPDANPQKVKSQLANYGIRVEEYGGDVIAVETSAYTGYGIDDLLDAILLVSHIQNLKAPFEGLGKGVVIDSRVDKGRGIVATILTKEGRIERGNFFVCGDTYGKVREIFDVLPDRFKRIEFSDPAHPCQIIGFSEIPEPGEKFIVVENEKIAREYAQKRKIQKQSEKLKLQKRLTLQLIQEKIQKGETKELKIVLKADVMGSLEAIKSALEELSLEEVKIKIIHAGVGPITKSDVLLAAASEAIVVGYHVNPLGEAKEVAEQQKIEIRTYKIIYQAIDDIRAAMLGLLEEEKKEVLVGKAIVRKVFNIKGIGLVAGSFVLEGKIIKDGIVKVLRKGAEIFKGKITSLKRFKEDVKEVEANYECGIGISGIEDLQEEDLLECYIEE